MDLDCLIIGGGAAGLTAATYLARFKRSVMVLDAGQSQLLRIPRSHNAPGYPEGIEGPKLHSRLVAQARSYGVRIEAAQVARVSQTSDGFSIETETGEAFAARTVLIASGIKVTEPAIDNIDACVARGLIRYCPICDGFEVQAKKIAVLGAHPHSIDEAHFLATYSADITYIPAHADGVVGEAERDRAKTAGIRVFDVRPYALLVRNDQIVVQRLGEEEAFDTLYPCLGVEPNTAFLSALPIATDEKGAITTDKHQATSVEGVYAAGDVTAAIDQIATAFGQAAIAATAIHNWLRARPLKHG